MLSGAGRSREIPLTPCRWTIVGILFVGCAAETTGATARRPREVATPPANAVDASVAADAGGQLSVDGGPSSPSAEAAPEVSGAFSVALDRAFPAARALAKATGHEAAEQASVVLYALADALDTIPGVSRRAADQLTEIRFEAKRLHRTDRLSFSVAHWIKEGLTAAMRVLETVSQKDDLSRFWIAQARASTEAIDATSGLTFQRAVVQDAIRTTLDAFTLRGQRRAP